MFKVTIVDQGWVQDPRLASEVESLFDSAIAAYRANQHLISEHANHEESIRVGGYANRTLLELVQNAADAMTGTTTADDENSGRVEIVLDSERGTLYCANSGRPFSKSGLISIAHAHLSVKRGDEIGRFGLGFKSVLAVSDSPRIYSRSISFEFNSAKSREALSGITQTARRYPVLRTATVIAPEPAFADDPILADLARWASTVIVLPRATNLERLRSDITSFPSEFLLFVGAVRQVRLRILGGEEFDRSHTSLTLGNGRFRIEEPDGTGEEWYVRDHMHRPSMDARKEVGEAVSRAEIKVTVAMPLRHGRLRTGRFWSYFPLQDETSASALFNAPWSVNDDRTTLLQNKYNHEILKSMAKLFVQMLPEVRGVEDPAAHLDYMPARGREALNFGDKLLCAYAPKVGVEFPIIPDGSGVPKLPADLRPLDFHCGIDDKDIHRAWIESPNTNSDVPHWRCYTTVQRLTRLRELFAAGVRDDDLTGVDRDLKKRLEKIPKRGLRSWLHEWAEGPDLKSAVAATKFAIKHQHALSEAAKAKVVPTTDGFYALADRNFIFLRKDEDVEVERAAFVSPAFLALPGVEELLRQNNFRDLDPLAVLKARAARLTGTSDGSAFERVWDAVLDVSQSDAIRTLTGNRHLKVPTRDGEWAFPYQVFDLGTPLGDSFAALTLDHNRCLPAVAHQLGVIREPVKRFLLEKETRFADYRAFVLEAVNDVRGPGERPVEKVDIDPAEGPGPFSVLFMLAESEASPQLRAKWTTKLLEMDGAEWTCDDIATNTTYTIHSPVRWAVERVGLLDTTKGLRRPDDIVAPTLLRYGDLLPLLRGSQAGRIADMLGLPKTLEEVHESFFEEALEADLFPPRIEDAVLVEFVLAAAQKVPTKLRKIPARVGRALEGRAPGTVVVAVTDEQVGFLSTRQRPYLRTTEELAGSLVSLLGCKGFQDSFSFSMFVEGRQESQRVLDVFTGLRETVAAEKLSDATFTRAVHIAKRVKGPDGNEEQSLESHLDGRELLVRSEVDDDSLLEIINKAFDLRLNNAELDEVRQTGLAHHLESMRQQALAATTDADRLDVYLGPDDMREVLPKGLWQALESQGHVGPDTSVAALLLTVFGNDTIKELKDLFLQAGFTDVPSEWAGRPATVSWLRKMGFGAEYAGRRNEHQDAEFTVPGAVKLSDLHDFQKDISQKLKKALTEPSSDGRHQKVMVELPTGAGKTRVATQTVLELFIEEQLEGPVLWIAQSQELCEQAVQTWSTVWRGLGDERPLTIGRLWEGNTVNEPDTEFSVIVATDAKLDVVLDTPEYEWLRSATAVIVDEGHRAGGSPRYTKILQLLGVAGHGWERPLVGLSATPFKGRSEAATDALASRFGHTKLHAFDPKTAYEELVNLDVLARVDHEVLTGVDVKLEPHERAEATRQGKVSASVLDRVGQNQRRMAILVDHIKGLDPSWPVLVFMPSVLSAQILAATLRFHDIEAQAVSGQTSRQGRRETINRFKEGKIRVLTNCDLLIQGFDAPGVRALYIARPTFSPNAYIQMAGRGLRGKANGGKERCLIVDMADNFGEFSDMLGFREFEHLWREGRS